MVLLRDARAFLDLLQAPQLAEKDSGPSSSASSQA